MGRLLPPISHQASTINPSRPFFIPFTFTHPPPPLQPFHSHFIVTQLPPPITPTFIHTAAAPPPIKSRPLPLKVQRQRHCLTVFVLLLSPQSTMSHHNYFDLYQSTSLGYSRTTILRISKETVVREVAKLLRLPELLQSIASIKVDYIEQVILSCNYRFN